RLAAAAAHISAEMSYTYDPWVVEQVEVSSRRSRARLGARESNKTWKEGWSMSLDRAADYALGESELESVAEAAPLSRREQEVARLLAAGLTNRQIGERLFISSRTVEGHIERISNKLGVRSRTQVAMWAAELGLITDRTANGRPPLGDSQRPLPDAKPGRDGV
ncbi:MAG TPA: response regulator transcription factor, partial [Candidatus Acidoferrum sp.]|nr:response regulator transcription factor [Candidatus Acidoferrum sp.]